MLRLRGARFRTPHPGLPSGRYDGFGFEPPAAPGNLGAPPRRNSRDAQPRPSATARDLPPHTAASGEQSGAARRQRETVVRRRRVLRASRGLHIRGDASPVTAASTGGFQFAPNGGFTAPTGGFEDAAATASQTLSLPARVAVAILGAYKRFLSPLLPRACRFEPTCSVYAREAIARYGLGRGSGLALRRLLRCHPFHSGGLDPVP